MPADAGPIIETRLGGTIEGEVQLPSGFKATGSAALRKRSITRPDKNGNLVHHKALKKWAW